MRSTPIAPGDPWVALGNGIRREVLARVAHRPCSVGEIARELPVSRPAVSQHLRILADAGLVRCRTEGRCNIYEARPEKLRGMRAELDRFWTKALANFKQIAEQSYQEDASSE
ncbi:MAG TPA: metalloregulator ArsR/SmtB family transcription factor [Actinomycetota bacterium]|nr:metalloregulator ArsR/SmtB family transcription factor [Actinomycetota bacterium]